MTTQYIEIAVENEEQAYLIKKLISIFHRQKDNLSEWDFKYIIIGRYCCIEIDPDNYLSVPFYGTLIQPDCECPMEYVGLKGWKTLPPRKNINIYQFIDEYFSVDGVTAKNSCFIKKDGIWIAVF